MSAPIKILELTEKPWDQRWQPLKEIAQKTLQLDINTEIKESSSKTVSEDLKNAMASDYQAIILSPLLSFGVAKNLATATQESILVGATDVLLREGNSWWPRPCLIKAFMRALASNSSRLDLSSFALVAGNDGYAHLSVAALVGLGFSTINIADSSDQATYSIIEEMKKKYFGITFNCVPFQTITTLPGVHSIVINSTPLILENELLDELYFFNFLKAGGVVVDLSLVPANTPLVQEAQAWGARHLSGDIIYAYRDSVLLEKLTGKKLPFEPYQKALREASDAVPFDSSPYLTRFRQRGS